MRVFSKKTLREFWRRHPDTEQVLNDWHSHAEKADWATPQQVKRDYPSASIIGGDRIVFNVKGNNYRLVVHIRYRAREVYVRFIGTHAEYDRIDAEEV